MSDVEPTLTLGVGRRAVGQLLQRGVVVQAGASDFGQASVPANTGTLVAISNGYGHAVALRSNGTVVAWGWNRWQQATVPPGTSGCVSVHAGFGTTFALKSNGALVEWGHSTSNFLPYNGVARFTLAYNESRNVFGWVTTSGKAYFLDLDDYLQSPSYLPLGGEVFVSPNAGFHVDSEGKVRTFSYAPEWASVPWELGPVRSLAPGDEHVVALLRDGSVTSWGNDRGGTTIVPTLPLPARSVHAALDASYAVLEDGSVVGWGRPIAPVAEEVRGAQFTRVATRGAHTLAITADGTLRAWGFSGAGAENPPPSVGVVNSIGAGRRHSIAATAGGLVLCWGDDSLGACSPPSDLGMVVEVAAGDAHSMARRSDGEVRCWGANARGECNMPSPSITANAIAAGHSHSLARTADGTLLGWGWNPWGQASPPSSLTNVSRFAGGQGHSIACTAAGTVVCWGSNSRGQSTVPSGIAPAVDVAAGHLHSAALLADGTVRCWGNNSRGQCSTPTTIGAPSTVFAFGDTTGVLTDLCPDDPLDTDPGQCGCGTIETDQDSDGVADCRDNCIEHPNPFQYDCNEDGIGDACTIAVEPARDCNGDGVLDDCDGSFLLDVTSAPASPVTTGEPLEFDLATPGIAAPGFDAELTITVRADLGLTTEFLAVAVEDVPIAILFQTDGIDCPSEPQVHTLTVPEALWTSAVRDGTTRIKLTPSGTVLGAECPTSEATVRLRSVLYPSSQDCNGNGLPDRCDIATGLDPDCDLDGEPNSCEIEHGSAVDCNANGIPDTCDISGASTDLDRDGRPDECGFVVGGSGFPDIQPAIDAAPSGTTITIAPGVYGPISITDKSLRLQVAPGASGVPVIEGANGIRPVTIRGAASAGTYLSGLEFRGGASESGGGALIEDALGELSIKFVWCRFCGNTALDDGGAVAVLDSRVLLSSCTFEANMASGSGGAVFSRGSILELSYSTLRDNEAGFLGGAVRVASGSAALRWVSATDNSSTSGGGLHLQKGATVSLQDCTVCLNLPDAVVGSWTDLGGNTVSEDCDGDLLCDADEIAAGGELDCDQNGVPDACQLAAGTATDVNENGILDICEPDCDMSGIPDSYEIASDPALDCDKSGVLDRCEYRPPNDCDEDSVLDVCEVLAGAADCNGNLRPDECDLAAGSRDCNHNGVPDECDIAAGAEDDDLDGLVDACEIARGDFDLNGFIAAEDLVLLLSIWGLPNPPLGDLNGDGIVSAQDVTILLSRWGPLRYE
jgi:alpha-tubulin suppressor-like RCC1 family protein